MEDKQRRFLDWIVRDGQNKRLTNTDLVTLGITTSVEIRMDGLMESGATRQMNRRDGSCAMFQSVTKVVMVVILLVTMRNMMECV